jgi:glycosyltransferase involved in cell wall biosynthesis
LWIEPIVVAQTRFLAETGFVGGGDPVLSGETILCFAPDPWAGLWRNRHQIMTRLARRNTVIYVEPRVYLGQAWRDLRAGRVSPADLRRPPLTHVCDGLWLYRDPVYAPYAGRRSGGPFTAWLRRRAMRTALARLHVHAPILWLLRPFHADQIGLYGEKLVIYHVTDEYSGFPTVTDVPGFVRQEEALLRRADLVFVTSPALLAGKGRHNPHTHLVPNAVDYAGFTARLASGRTLPGLADAAGGIGRPRIGYVGALNEKIDFGLLTSIATRRPDWQMVLVGALDLTRDAGKADALKRMPNVHWLGRVPVEGVPLAIAGLDVCLLPYERNEWTAHIDSLKLYEYLACGQPVVASDVPAARTFASLVRIAEGPAGFVSAIEDALAEGAGADRAALCEARRAAAAANTWDMRVAQIEELIGDALRLPRQPR